MRQLWKKLTGWILCLIMAAGVLPEMAREAKAYRDADFEIDGIQYEIIDDDSVLVTGCNDKLKNVTIPSEVTYDNKQYSVNGIGPEAFYECNSMHNVTIPGSVKEMGWNVITVWECQLKKDNREHTLELLYNQITSQVDL